MINTVLFDFVNTIAFLTPLREDILIKYCQEQHNINFSKKQIQKIYMDVDEQNPYSSVTIKTNKDKKNFYKKYNQTLFSKLRISGAENYYDFYHSVEKSWSLDKCIPELLNSLKSNNISIGIISNFDDNLEDILENLKIKHMFNFIVVSAQVGLEKPNTELYEYVKKQYEININNSIYIGDSYNLDYIPASEAGFKTFLIDRQDIINKKINKIKNLNEIKEILSSNDRFCLV
mgnify:CR=1 FL=1|tara:strand:- start:388 stop:1083 length:696 start_codon:yes stop_codon:yes gene_type:complete